MHRYEAKAFVDLTHDLLRQAAGGHPQTAALLELEAQAEEILAGDLSELRIITSEPVCECANPVHLDHFRLQPVAEIERHGEGFVAVSVPYERDGRWLQDRTYSRPEGWLGSKPYGAASALAARLLEARAAGVH